MLGESHAQRAEFLKENGCVNNASNAQYYFNISYKSVKGIPLHAEK